MCCFSGHVCRAGYPFSLIFSVSLIYVILILGAYGHSDAVCEEKHQSFMAKITIDAAAAMIDPHDTYAHKPQMPTSCTCSSTASHVTWSGVHCTQKCSVLRRCTKATADAHGHLSIKRCCLSLTATFTCKHVE